MAEFLDIVDEKDNVVGRASRSECHAKGLLHRSVMFFIFDEAGRIFVNKRSSSKEFFGGRWSIVLGGHVPSGKSYYDAVVREAREEAGIKSKPFRMGFFRKRLPEELENVVVYGFKSSGSLRLLKEEVEYGGFMTLEGAVKKMEAEEFLPETGQLLSILNEFMAHAGKNIK
jgi:isopentenyldiphosphate isomerase